MNSGGAPLGYSITIADGSVQEILGNSTGRTGFTIQNLTVGTAPAGRVILGGAGVDDATGYVIMPRASAGDKPSEFQDVGSEGKWYARARGADVTLMVLVKR
jgi:hypothetical protein